MIEQNSRKAQVLDLASIYANRYTCACMCDRLDDEKKYCREAVEWMLAQKSANNITNEELKEALQTLEKQAEEEHEPFGYDQIVFMQ